MAKSIGRLMAALLCNGLAAHAASTLPEGPGRRTIERVCANCHELEVVTDKRLDRPQWEDIVNEMIGFGAKLTKTQASEVVNYLARNFGKKDRGRQLVEDVCTYCHSLQKLNGQELSKEQWRDLIKGMISEGAPVTDEEFSLIVDYLAKQFGKKDP
jgi:cytochrome c5